MKNITRKCDLCKQLIDIDNDDKDTYFIKTNINKDGTKIRKFIHCNCYIDKYTNLKKNKKTIEECNDDIELFKLNMMKELSSTMEKQKFFNWISDTYNASFFPNYFYMKIDSITKGTYKGQNEPICLADLNDMWKRKINYLDGIAERNRKKGTTFNTPISRINYDLAILLTKYDSYKTWKENKRLETNEQSIELIQQKEERVNFKSINTSNLNNKANISDISDILNEI